jgi:AI-2E family transporter
VMGDAVDLHPAVMILALVVGGALFGIGGVILAAPTVAAGRDLYRYGFHRFGGQPPANARELAMHGAKPDPAEPEERPPPSAEPPPAAGEPPPPEAEASLP